MSAPQLSQDFFESRREKLFDAMGDHAIAIIEGGQTTPNHIKFRQSSDFYYLTGFDEPNAIAVLLRHEDKRTYALFVPPRDPSRERWDGKRAGVEGATADFLADEAHPIDELEKRLPPMIDKAWRAHLKLNIDSHQGRTLHRAYQQSAKSSDRPGHGVLELCDPSWLLATLRVHKTPEEVAMIRQAVAITEATYAEVAPQIRPGAWEYEIEAALDHGFRSRGGDGSAYASIVGGGDNSTCLHYVSNDEPLRDGEVLLIDAGGMYGHYAADVTRTYPINGKFTDAQRRVYETVLRAQKAMVAAAKPGIPLKELHDLSVRMLTEGMIELGLLDDRSVDEHIEAKTFRQFYMHGSGHHLGLDVHDSAPSAVDGEPFKLGEGCVFTIEPGMYISHGSEGAPEEYHGVGVRIEDNALITADGAENLTAGIPKEADDVEASVSG